MGKVISCGLTVAPTKETMSVRRKRAKECSRGQMEGSIGACGRTESRTAEESTAIRPEWRGKDCGLRERRLNGLIEAIYGLTNLPLNSLLY